MAAQEFDRWLLWLFVRLLWKWRTNPAAFWDQTILSRLKLSSLVYVSLKDIRISELNFYLCKNIFAKTAFSSYLMFYQLKSAVIARRRFATCKKKERDKVCTWVCFLRLFFSDRKQMFLQFGEKKNCFQTCPFKWRLAIYSRLVFDLRPNGW